MTIESAKFFLEKMQNDNQFYQIVVGKKTAEEQLLFVKNAGFDITNQELDSVMQKLSFNVLDQVTTGNFAMKSDDTNQSRWLGGGIRG